MLVIFSIVKVARGKRKYTQAVTKVVHATHLLKESAYLVGSNEKDGIK